MLTVTEKVDFIRKAFGGITHDRNFVNVSVLCPWCHSQDATYTKKKLVIHTERWVYHCWRCDARGRSLIPLLRKSGASDLIEEFVTRFATDLSWIDDDDTESETIVRLPHDFRLLASRIGSLDPSVQRALSYLHERGATTRDLWFFKFGISAEREFSDRVIMPSFDGDGRLNYHTSRRTDGRQWMKYLNADVPRGSIIFNELNIDWSKPLNMVEGPFDLVKCPENAVPLLGCDLNENSRLFNEVLRHETPVVLMLDSEAHKRQDKIARRFDSYDVPVQIVSLGATDPGDMKSGDVKRMIDRAVPWTPDASLRTRIAAL